MYRQQQKFGINAIIFILFTANTWLRSLQVSAARLATTRGPFVLRTTREDDQDQTARPGLADFEVDCSKAGPGLYTKMTPDYIKRTKMPLGCGYVFGKNAFVKCAKIDCPCRDKTCGDTCVPVKPGGGRGPFKCEKTPTTAGTFSNCVPATSVKCPGSTTTGQAKTTRTPFRVPTKTTPTDDTPVPVVSCSKFGADYKKMGQAELERMEKFLPLGCSMVSGTGRFANCRKMFCPCDGKACGDTCSPAKAGTGVFKCQARAKGFGCVAEKSVQCPGSSIVVTTTTTTTTTSNLRSRDPKKMTGLALTTSTTSTGSSKTTVATTTGTDVATTTGTDVATTTGTDVATTTGTDVATTTGTGVATTEAKKVTVTTVTKATTVNIGAKGTKATIDATVGDAKTGSQMEPAVAAEDQGCAKEIALVAVLLPVLLFFSQ